MLQTKISILDRIEQILVYAAEDQVSNSIFSSEIFDEDVASNTSIETLEGASTGNFERFVKD